MRKILLIIPLLILFLNACTDEKAPETNLTDTKQKKEEVDRIFLLYLFFIIFFQSLSFVSFQKCVLYSG